MSWGGGQVWQRRLGGRDGGGIVDDLCIVDNLCIVDIYRMSECESDDRMGWPAGISRIFKERYSVFKGCSYIYVVDCHFTYCYR